MAPLIRFAFNFVCEARLVRICAGLQEASHGLASSPSVYLASR
jgi:hypothetical protein